MRGLQRCPLRQGRVASGPCAKLCRGHLHEQALLPHLCLWLRCGAAAAGRHSRGQRGLAGWDALLQRHCSQTRGTRLCLPPQWRHWHGTRAGRCQVYSYGIPQVAPEHGRQRWKGSTGAAEGWRVPGSGALGAGGNAFEAIQAPGHQGYWAGGCDLHLPFGLGGCLDACYGPARGRRIAAAVGRTALLRGQGEHLAGCCAGQKQHNLVGQGHHRRSAYGPALG
mmetsp:Transcript_61075/g.145525  ORF Transcript_61075/g.145525 Transcript_61075/m.145525 type:complete len:223 (+) Transcript_61075:933-1601(+)